MRTRTTATVLTATVLTATVLTATVLTATVLAAPSTVGAAAAASAAPQASTCRPAWTLVAPPPVPGGPVALSQTLAGINSVTALSARNVWFSGSLEGQSVQPWVLRWDGRTVRPARQIPRLPLDGQDGGAGSFDSATDGWVLADNAGATPAGMGIHDPSTATPFAERWHGGRWTMTPLAVSPRPRTTGTMLNGISSVSAANAWGVGLFYRAKPGVTAGTAPTGALIEHWDGTSWSIVPNPASARPGGELSSLTVVSPANIWAVGRQQDAAGTVVPLAEHWNGSSWRTAAVPAASAPSAFYAVSAHGGDDVWAVGDQTKPGTKDIAVPLAEHWDGRSWAAAHLPDVGSALLTGVYDASPADVWATVYTPAAVPAVLLHDHAGTWAAVPAPGPQAYGLTYYYAGIDGTGPRDVWAVGTASNDSTAGSNPLIARLHCR
jgi:hypothetical protein